jgi:cytochrome c oxidase subunit 2
MAISPPPQRIWWNIPIARTEIIWIIIAFSWGLLMFSAMVYWHIYGEQNLSNESYRTTPAAFSEKANAMVAQYREEAGLPVVHPPPGSDVYMIARLWQWWPILEFEKDQTYRLHLSSMDWQHGFSLQPVNINLQVHPNYDMVVTLTPNESGEFGVICNEFCGIGHHTMIGKIYVTE